MSYKIRFILFASKLCGDSYEYCDFKVIETVITAMKEVFNTHSHNKDIALYTVKTCIGQQELSDRSNASFGCRRFQRVPETTFSRSSLLCPELAEVDQQQLQ